MGIYGTRRRASPTIETNPANAGYPQRAFFGG